MDCPDRERAQWWGDVVNESGEAFYALDEKAHALTRKGMRELMDWQRADSTIFSPVPAGNYDSELPMQMLASVGYYGFWNYYMGTGDTATIRYVYPKVKKYIRLWKTDSLGLVVPRKGGWTWGDWGDNKDMEPAFQPMVCHGFARLHENGGSCWRWRGGAVGRGCRKASAASVPPALLERFLLCFPWIFW